MQNSLLSKSVSGDAPSLPAGIDAADFAGLASVLTGISALPRILQLLEAQTREIASLKGEITALRTSSTNPADGWLDAKAAAGYLSMSPGTFDKFRYQTTPRIKGYKVGGKTLYKREDLDTFVKLWQVKSSGLA